jgi:low molecular weight protein-tyrosine phosphatase
LAPSQEGKVIGAARAIRALSRGRRHAKQPAMITHRILFVCLGNICRSPMAEGVFRRVAEEEGLIDRFEIDSAGLGDWHIGQAPDHRAQKAARSRGVDISSQSARQVVYEDFDRFDLVLAMDGSNLAELKARAPHEARGKIRPFLDFAPHVGTKDVPDPFFGGVEGFDRALDLIEAASRGLLASLTAKDRVAAKRGA